MPLVDEDYVRKKGNLPSASVLSDEKLNAFFSDAERRLRKWVGSSAYEDAAAATPTDSDRALALKDAEAFLVICEGLPSWNRAAVGAGIVKEKTIGSAHDQIVLLTPDEIDSEIRRCLEQAERAAQPYIIITDLSFDPIKACND